MPAIFWLLGAGTCCLMPFGIYLLAIGSLARRREPVLIRGSQDFTLLLMGLSGFLVIGLTVFTAVTDGDFRDQWLAGKMRFAALSTLWWVSAGVYFAVVGALIAATYRWRQGLTFVYGLGREASAAQLEAAMNRVGVEYHGTPEGYSLPSDAGGRAGLIEWLPAGRSVACAAFTRVPEKRRRQIEEEWDSRLVEQSRRPLEWGRWATAVGAGVSSLAAIGVILLLTFLVQLSRNG